METRETYAGVLGKNWIISFCRSIGYPIGPPYKLYEENHVTIKTVLSDRITHQARHLEVLIIDLHKHHIRKNDMVGKKPNIEFNDLNYKPHGGESLRDLIDHAIGNHFYPPSGYDHHKLLCLEKLHGRTHHQLDSHDNTDKK